MQIFLIFSYYYGKLWQVIGILQILLILLSSISIKLGKFSVRDRKLKLIFSSFKQTIFFTFIDNYEDARSMASARCSRAKKLDSSLFNAPKEIPNRNLNMYKVDEIMSQQSSSVTDNYDDHQSVSSSDASIVGNIPKQAPSIQSPNYADELAASTSNSNFFMAKQCEETTVRPSEGLNLSDEHQLSIEKLSKITPKMNNEDSDSTSSSSYSQESSSSKSSSSTSQKSVGADKARPLNVIDNDTIMKIPIVFDENNALLGPKLMLVDNEVQISPQHQPPVESSNNQDGDDNAEMEILQSYEEKTYEVFFEHAPGKI